jgi:hypothetical protein
MNHLHLQEAAKHYAKLAEEAQKNLEQEQELNEDLFTIIDALCEELGINVEDLLNEDVFDLESGKISRKRVLAARKGERKAEKKANTYFLPQEHPARQAAKDELKRHTEMGASDTIYKHDAATGGFKASGKLPKGSAQAAASQGQRFGGDKMTAAQASGLKRAAKKHGGLVASAGWEDPEVDPMDMDTVVRRQPKPGAAITKPSQNAREWGRH